MNNHQFNYFRDKWYVTEQPVQNDWYGLYQIQDGKPEYSAMGEKDMMEYLAATANRGVEANNELLINGPAADA